MNVEVEDLEMNRRNAIGAMCSLPLALVAAPASAAVVMRAGEDAVIEGGVFDGCVFHVDPHQEWIYLPRPKPYWVGDQPKPVAELFQLTIERYIRTFKRDSKGRVVFMCGRLEGQPLGCGSIELREDVAQGL